MCCLLPVCLLSPVNSKPSALSVTVTLAVASTDPGLNDTDDVVRFGEAGWKDRYYFAKFQKESHDEAFVRQMTHVSILFRST